MKLKSLVSLVCLIAVGCLSQAASAALVLTVGTDTFAPNSGIRAIDILVRSNAADTSFFLSADFQLSAGVFPATAGIFGQAGMVGVGNIQDPPASQFVSAGDNTATLSLDFTNAQLFPAVDTLLARMFIDTTGLAIGTYSIQVTAFASQVAGSTMNDGSITISPIPEPSALCLVGLTSLCVLRRRKPIRVNPSKPDA